MRIERQRDRGGVVRQRELACTPDQRAMADVHAVEVADRDGGTVAPAGYALMAAEHIHATSLRYQRNMAGATTIRNPAVAPTSACPVGRRTTAASRASPTPAPTAAITSGAAPSAPRDSPTPSEPTATAIVAAAAYRPRP